MITLTEVLRWFVYRIGLLYNRTAAFVMRRDRLLLGSERRFRALLESAPDAMIIIDWHGHVSLVNAQAEALFGYPRDEIIGQNFTELLAERFRSEQRQLIKAYLRAAERNPIRSNIDLYGRAKEGVEFPIEMSMGPIDTETGPLISTAIRDISERKHNEEQLRYVADHDALTGLMNRRRFEEQLAREVALGVHEGHDGAMLLIDIDNLKDVNDVLGHSLGDELIRSVGVVVADGVRASDVVARIGGDEFGVLLSRTTAETAHQMALDLLHRIREHRVLLGGQRVRLTVSIGVATLGDGETESEDVLVAADFALYDAKGAGRDRVAVNAPLAEEVVERRARATWSQRIRRALDEGLLVAYHQPIMSLPGRTIQQYELLVRMLDEDGSPIPPGAFLPTAERTGLIVELDRFMVSRAIDLIADSQRAGKPISYCVNLSARSVADPSLPNVIAGKLAESEIDRSLLVFEITETAAIANMEEARGFANALRDLGCGFVLDDFGAGFASFYYLKHLPLDGLKIDGDFIRNLPRSRVDQLVVKHIGEIAAALGMYTIAEFVEDSETLDMLTTYGIDRAQGYHIGRPEPTVESTTAAGPHVAPRQVRAATVAAPVH